MTREAAPPGDCISVVQGEATILVSRQIVEQLSAARPEKSTREQERLAVIRGDRVWTCANRPSS